MSAFAGRQINVLHQRDKLVEFSDSGIDVVALLWVLLTAATVGAVGCVQFQMIARIIFHEV